MKATSSNWGSLKSKLSKEGNTTVSVRGSTTSSIDRQKRTDLNKACKGIDVVVTKNESEKKEEKKLGGDHMNAKMKSNYVGLDCEMVGIGLSGKQSALARCCMVDFEGEVIYDKYVRPKGFVTDFRTQWSGIRKQDLRAGEAITLLECQENVTALLKDKFLVGHALKNDLDVLMLGHPKKMIRDTACFKPYMRPHGRNGGKMKPRSLKELTKQHLGLQIQTGEHDPGEDARSAMFLYRLKMKEWEEGVRASRALQSAAFKNKNGAVTVAAASASSSSSSSSSDTTVPSSENQSHPLGASQPHRSVKDKDRDSGLSGKERRNLRRNGTPLLSLKGKTHEPFNSASMSMAAFSSSSSSSSSMYSNKDHSNGINSAGGRNSLAPTTKSVSVSSTINVSTYNTTEKKRKEPSSSSATGMFFNDVTAANSITDVDKRMGTIATKSNISKKQRR